jgi:hypothetical protein
MCTCRKNIEHATLFPRKISSTWFLLKIEANVISTRFSIGFSHGSHYDLNKTRQIFKCWFVTTYIQSTRKALMVCRVSVNMYVGEILQVLVGLLNSVFSDNLQVPVLASDFTSLCWIGLRAWDRPKFYSSGWQISQSSTGSEPTRSRRHADTQRGEMYALTSVTSPFGQKKLPNNVLISPKVAP